MPPKVAEPNASTVRLEFDLEAPVDRVFRAWTEPTVLADWFGPTEGTTADVELDVRVGGPYRITMGSRTVRGRYLAVDPPTFLSFTWLWDDDDPPVATEVAVWFYPAGKRTRMVLEHTRLPLEVDCMGFETGWRRTIARLAKRFARTAAGGAEAADVPYGASGASPT